jgi:methylase of polypeptide subunit release factors
VWQQLIDDQAVAGAKAFNWQQEFPQVFANCGFDVVIGNPPYVTGSIISAEKDYIKSTIKLLNTNLTYMSYSLRKA